MPGEWLEREVLITVKAYPNPSAKHFETVCIAGITREEGLVRLYPVNFRSLPEDQRFKKYQLVSVRMAKHERDQRPESYRPDEHSIRLLREVPPDKDWERRWHWVRPVIGSSMCELIRRQKELGASLGVIKPRVVENVEFEDAPSEWGGRKQSAVDQLPLFDPASSKLERIPFVFRYCYRCETVDCRGHEQAIIDWELMEFYRRQRNAGLRRDELLAEIRHRWLEEICRPDKDTHFFVGNHSRFPASFMVLGAFWPPRTAQASFL